MTKREAAPHGGVTLWTEGTYESMAQFVAALAAGGEVAVTVMEVPLTVFIEAGDNLRDLQIEVDEHGQPFLMGMLFHGDHKAVLVSESFVPVTAAAEPGEGEA